MRHRTKVSRHGDWRPEFMHPCPKLHYQVMGSRCSCGIGTEFLSIWTSETKNKSHMTSVMAGVHLPKRSRDSSVGIATRYGLDGPGIESRWGARFSVPVQTGCEAHPASYKMDTGSFPGVKRPGRGVDHPPHLAPRLKKE